jgi:hypothetical protein
VRAATAGVVSERGFLFCSVPKKYILNLFEKAFEIVVWGRSCEED